MILSILVSLLTFVYLCDTLEMLNTLEASGDYGQRRPGLNVNSA